MKKPIQFVTELTFTVAVSAVLSTLVTAILFFIFANLDVSDKAAPAINWVSGILFGLMVGFKLKTLILQYKKK